MIVSNGGKRSLSVTVFAANDCFASWPATCSAWLRMIPRRRSPSSTSVSKVISRDIERAWARHGGRVVQRLAGASSWYAEQQRVPVVLRGELRIARGIQVGQAEAFVLPPTLAGWRQFLDLAPTSGLKFSELEQTGLYWWDRRIPRNLLSATRDAEAEAA